MVKKIKSIAAYLAAVIAILAIFVVAYAVFIAGPFRAYETEDQRFVNKMLELSDFKNPQARLLNRFSLDKVYYIVHVEDKGQEYLVWFDASLSKITKEDYKGLDEASTIALGLGMEQAQVNFGVYKGAVIYVIKAGPRELFIDRQSHEVLLEIGGIPFVVE